MHDNEPWFPLTPRKMIPQSLVVRLGEADVRGFEAFRAVQARLEQVKYEDFDREIGVFGDVTP
jgi:hypothetical protein